MHTMPRSVSQAGTPKKAEHGDCCQWSGLQEVTYQQPAMCVLQSWMLNMWGPKPRAWEEVLTRADLLPEEEPGKAGWFQSLCPHRSSPSSQALEVLVGCIAMGANAERVVYANINVCLLHSYLEGFVSLPLNRISLAELTSVTRCQSVLCMCLSPPSHF